MANKKILVIEDEEDLLNLITSKLKKESFDVITAKNGQEGYKKIIEEKPDLVLLDVVMPVMDGYDVLEKLQDAQNKIPVIIISNSGQLIEIEKTKKLGAKDHLIKTDFNPSDLVKMVKQHLGKEADENQSFLPRNNVIGPKIILVEDEPFLRELCAEELSKTGYSVYEICDGDEALTAVKAIKPGLVLLDILLPSVNGFEILEMIKKDKEICKIPVVIFSNYNQDDQKTKAKKLGAEEFIVKSEISPTQIVERVKKYI